METSTTHPAHEDAVALTARWLPDGADGLTEEQIRDKADAFVRSVLEEPDWNDTMALAYQFCGSEHAYVKYISGVSRDSTGWRLIRAAEDARMDSLLIYHQNAGGDTWAAGDPDEFAYHVNWHVSQLCRVAAYVAEPLIAIAAEVVVQTALPYMRPTRGIAVGGS